MHLLLLAHDHIIMYISLIVVHEPERLLPIALPDVRLHIRNAGRAGQVADDAGAGLALVGGLGVALVGVAAVIGLRGLLFVMVVPGGGGVDRVGLLRVLGVEGLDVGH